MEEREILPHTPKGYIKLFLIMLLVITLGITLLNQGAGLIAKN